MSFAATVIATSTTLVLLATLAGRRFAAVRQS